MKNFKVFLLYFAFCFCETKCVINGKPALQGQYPFLVRVTYSLDVPYSDQYVIICSGVLVNEYWVLTAGHCVQDKLPAKLKIIVGYYNRGADKPEQQLQVKNVKIYPPLNLGYAEHIRDYVSITELPSHDIALLQLNKSVVLEKNIHPVELSEPDFVVKDEIQFAGWGWISEGPQGHFPSVLQTSRLHSINNNICTEDFEERYEEIIRYSLCAKTVGKNVSLCRGDSGGGAFCKNETHTVLCGILSFNFNCDSSIPSVFVPMANSSVLKWLRETMYSNVQGKHETYVDAPYYIIIPLPLLILIILIVLLVYIYFIRVPTISSNVVSQI